MNSPAGSTPSIDDRRLRHASSRAMWMRGRHSLLPPCILFLLLLPLSGTDYPLSPALKPVPSLLRFRSWVETNFFTLPVVDWLEGVSRTSEFNFTASRFCFFRWHDVMFLRMFFSLQDSLLDWCTFRIFAIKVYSNHVTVPLLTHCRVVEWVWVRILWTGKWC
jgi:hypothetical protein